MQEQSFAIRYDRWCGWLLGLFGAGRRWSAVVVDETEVAVRLGWSFRAVIPRSSIVAVEPDTERVLGWGAHGWRGTWLVNGSSHGLVRLTIEPAARARVCGVPVRLRVLRVSVEAPEQLIAALA